MKKIKVYVTTQALIDTMQERLFDYTKETDYARTYSNQEIVKVCNSKINSRGVAELCLK